MNPNPYSRSNSNTSTDYGDNTNNINISNRSSLEGSMVSQNDDLIIDDADKFDLGAVESNEHKF